MSVVRSMTGYAAVSGARFTLTAKSVNHRFLDLQVRVPGVADTMEDLLRSVVRGAVTRGHIEVFLQMDTASGGIALRRDDALLAALVMRFREAAALHGLVGEPDLNRLMGVPGVMVAEAEGMGLEPGAVAAAAEELMVRFNAARAAEGAALAEEMRAGMDRLLLLVEEMAGLRAGVRDAHLTRLRERLRELVGETEAGSDRVLVEAALLAQRSDVEEEIVRLRTHALRFKAMLEAGGELGKALDFLLQEMAREANTCVSKVNGAMGEAGLRLTDVGLAMKGEIERVKEQVQNLE